MGERGQEISMPVISLEIYQAVVFPSRVENGLRWAVLFLYL